MNTAAWAFAGTVLMFLGTLATAAFAYAQSRRNAVTAPYDQLSARVVHLESQVDALRAEVRQAKDEAHESRNAAEQAVSENVAWADHHLSVVEVVAAVRRPWPVVPKALRHRITDSDYPSVPLVEDPAPVPDPADDGQDEDPTTT